MKRLLLAMTLLAATGCDYGGPDARVALPDDPPDIFVVANVSGQNRLVRVSFADYGTAFAVQPGAVLRTTASDPPAVRLGSSFLEPLADPFMSGEPLGWGGSGSGASSEPDVPLPPVPDPVQIPSDNTVPNDGLEPFISSFDPGGFASGEQLGFDEGGSKRKAATSRLGTNPTGIGVTQDLRLVVVANHGAIVLHIYDRVSRSLLSPIPMPAASRPYALAMGPSDIAYVTNFKNNGATLIAVDIPQRRVIREWNIGDYPAGVAVTPDGTQVWVTSWASNNVLVIDLLSGSVVTQIQGLDDAWGITFNPTGTRAYVAAASAGLGNVFVIDTAAYSQIARIAVGAEPRQVRVTPSGRHVFATNFGGDAVTQIDALTNRVVRHITVGRTPAALALSVR